jgi:hypothetical protein
MEHGWTLDVAGQRWVLAGPDGVLVTAYPVQMTSRPESLASLNAFALRHGRPTLDPAGGSWWHCALIGGPVDGWHEWLDPGVYGQPPGVLFAAGPLRRAVVIPMADTGPGGSYAIYRRQPRVGCEHGESCRGCPVPYCWTLA